MPTRVDAAVRAAPDPALAPDSPDLADTAAAGFGVYVHVPFCSHKCGYCDFASWAGKDDLQERYVGAVVAEIEGADLPPADSVYVGGGTPSRLRPGLLRRLTAGIAVLERAEVTVEANPESATPAFFAEAAAAGVTRVSLGMQSSAPHVLRFLDRQHRHGSVAAAAAAARGAGIRSVNLDLIFGTPGERLADWRASLEAALALDPDHVSAYALTVEPATELGRRVRAGDATEPDEDDCADKYAVAQELLAGAGYVQYEISNWARHGHASRHNLLYWGCGSYTGVGCSAHTHDALRARRSWNVASPERYCEAVESRRDPEAGYEDLSPAEVRAERLQLGLRRATGVPEAWLAGRDLGPAESLVERQAGRARLAAHARFRANQVLVRV